MPITDRFDCSIETLFIGIYERKSARQFCFPGKCFTVYLNSASVIIQLAIQLLGSSLFGKYFTTTLSVNSRK